MKKETNFGSILSLILYINLLYYSLNLFFNSIKEENKEKKKNKNIKYLILLYLKHIKFNIKGEMKILLM